VRNLLPWWFYGAIIAAILDGAGWVDNYFLAVPYGRMNPAWAIFSFAAQAALLGYFAWFFIASGRRTIARIRGEREKSVRKGAETDHSA
jgi:hypothetical protein